MSDIDERRRGHRRLAALIVALAFGAAACSAGSAGTHPASVSSSAPPRTPASTTPTVSRARTSTAAPTSSSASATGAADRRAAHTIAQLADGLGRGGVSVAVRDTSTGATFVTGAGSGMYEGSIAKLDIVETLMLAHQRSHTALSRTERDLVSDMIEHSDNHAADTLWTREGGRRAVGAANAQLGLHATRLGDGIYWGLSTTSATDQLALLQALVTTHGPLDAQSRDYVLRLMRGVETDQRWGVATLAEHPDAVALKNGWLPNAADDDRWLVNSLGVVARDGHTYLMAVLTQHGASFAAGIRLTEQIARAALPAVR